MPESVTACNGAGAHRPPSDRPLRRIGQMGRPAAGRAVHTRSVVL